MNNEIKEILDFKENADYKKLSCDEVAILRDYITNLQERIEKAVEYINYCDDLSVVNDYSITEKPIIEKLAKKDLLNILNGRSDK